MSRFCQMCVTNKASNKNTKHNCTLNHEGSAPKMEQSGIIRIFERSISKNNLCYTECYGDGDTKCYTSVKYIYPHKTVVKNECIGHVQKRVGKRLRALKKVGKGLGKLGLNDAMINRLQNYFGIFNFLSFFSFWSQIHPNRPLNYILSDIFEKFALNGLSHLEVEVI